MRELTVSFLYFHGCPHAPRTRHNLDTALALIGKKAKIKVEEVDLMDPNTPEHLKRWGSPTVLINGTDVTGAKPGSACCCRIYAGGVPSSEEILGTIDAGLER